MSPDDTPVRLCVRAMSVSFVFPLVDGLPSTVSAGVPLFGGFPSTMPSSDFPKVFLPSVWFITFPDRPHPPSGQGAFGTSRFPRKEFPHMLRVSDSAEPLHSSRMALSSVWPSASVNSVGVPVLLISLLNG